MNVLIFNGSVDVKKNTTAYAVSHYFHQQFIELGYEVTVFNVADANIPFFNLELNTPPVAAQLMCDEFRKADFQIWLTPLFHGSMTGVMKNCLDWLELTSKNNKPYLTGKIVGLACWADGGQAMLGINAMDSVAKSLRAWVLPFSVPVIKGQLYEGATFSLADSYKDKFDRMINLLAEAKPITTINSVSL